MGFLVWVCQYIRCILWDFPGHENENRRSGLLRTPTSDDADDFLELVRQSRRVHGPGFIRGDADAGSCPTSSAAEKDDYRSFTGAPRETTPCRVFNLSRSSAAGSRTPTWAYYGNARLGRNGT
jgi:hypothetical protein